MINEVLDVFTYTGWFSILMVVGLGLVNWSRLSLSFRILVLGQGLYLVILPITYLKINPLFGWNSGAFYGYLLSIIFGVTFTTIYALNLPAGMKRWVVILFGLAGNLYLLLDMVFISGIHSIAGYSMTIMTGLQIIFTLIFLYHLARYPAGNSLLTNPLFWVSLGQLSSGFGDGLMNVFYIHVVSYSHLLLAILFIVCYFFIIIANILYVVGIWKERNFLSRLIGVSS